MGNMVKECSGNILAEAMIIFSEQQERVPEIIHGTTHTQRAIVDRTKRQKALKFSGMRSCHFGINTLVGHIPTNDPFHGEILSYSNDFLDLLRRFPRRQPDLGFVQRIILGDKILALIIRCYRGNELGHLTHLR